jgi:hypothetical protein
MQISTAFSSSYLTPAPTGASARPAATPSASSVSDSSASGVSSYDFTSMTPGALQSTINGLVKSGKLSLKDSSPLVTIAGFAGGAGKPINVLSALQAGIDYKQTMQAGDPTSGIQHWQTALATLQGLQGTASGVDTVIKSARRSCRRMGRAQRNPSRPGVRLMGFAAALRAFAPPILR